MSATAQTVLIRRCLVVTGLSLVGLGTLFAATNPGPDRFEQFALTQASIYLQQQVCTQPLPVLGIRLVEQCQQLVQQNSLAIALLLRNSTRREDYCFFSLYRTDLAIANHLPFLPRTLGPRYEVKTLAVLGRFYILSARPLAAEFPP
jgi:hypothetical protein